VTIFVLFFYSQFFENRRRGAVRRRQGQRPSGAGKAAGTSRQWCSSGNPSPFRGAKHFHTAAPMGRRCESAFALLSHQKV